MARFTIEDLTGEQYDRVEKILGRRIGDPEVSVAHLTRAVGFVRTCESDPDLKYSEYNKRTVAQFLEDSGMRDEPGVDEAGKD